MYFEIVYNLLIWKDYPRQQIKHYVAKDFTAGGSVQVPVPQKEDCTCHMSLKYVLRKCRRDPLSERSKS